MTVNIDDKEFILRILDDYEERCIGLDLDEELPGIHRARAILQRNFFKESDEKIVDPRQLELQFSDWHQSVWDDDGED